MLKPLSQRVDRLTDTVVRDLIKPESYINMQKVLCIDNQGESGDCPSLSLSEFCDSKLYPAVAVFLGDRFLSKDYKWTCSIDAN